MYGIYGNIYHQYIPNVSIYIPYMDPMGIDITPGPATSSPNPNMSQVHPPKHPLQHWPVNQLVNWSVDQSKSGYKHHELILNVYIYMCVCVII